MDLDGGDCLRKVLAHNGRDKAGQISKIAGVDGLSPGGDHGAETAAV